MTEAAVDEAIIADGSAWSSREIATFFTTTTIPCRLSCVTSQGFPHVTSLWFLHAGGALYFSVQENAGIYRWLDKNPKCGFEIAVNEPPYRGVRGRGRAACMPASEYPVLPELLDRFLGTRSSDLARWLLSRGDTEITVRVTPEWLTSWDYGERM